MILCKKKTKEKSDKVYIDIIDETREHFKDKPFMPEEERMYYLE